MGYIWDIYGINMGYIRNEYGPTVDQHMTNGSPKA